MTSKKHGGARPKVRPDDKRGGARKGTGPKPGVKWKKTRVKNGGSVVIERGKLGDLPSPPEVWELASVQEGSFELQRTVDGRSEIMTISELNFWNNEKS